jgi:hypothetical protein
MKLTENTLATRQDRGSRNGSSLPALKTSGLPTTDSVEMHIKSWQRLASSIFSC